MQERLNEATWIDAHQEVSQSGEGSDRVKIGYKGEHEIVAIPGTGCERHSPGKPIAAPCPLILRARIARQAASIQAELDPKVQGRLEKLMGVESGIPYLSMMSYPEASAREFETTISAFESVWARRKDAGLLSDKLEEHVLRRGDIDLEEEWEDLKSGSPWEKYTYEDLVGKAVDDPGAPERGLLESLYRLAYDTHRTQVVDEIHVFANVRPGGKTVVFDTRTKRLSITTGDGEFDAFFTAGDGFPYYQRDLSNHNGTALPMGSRPAAVAPKSLRPAPSESGRTDPTADEPAYIAKEGSPPSSEYAKGSRSSEPTEDSLEETDLELDEGHRIRLRNNKIERCSDCDPIAQAYHPALHHPGARKYYDKLMTLQAAFDDPKARNPSKRQIASVVRKIEEFARGRADVSETLSENRRAVVKALAASGRKSDLLKLIPELNPDEFSLLAKGEGYLSDTEWRNLSTALATSSRAASAADLIIAGWKTSLDNRTRLLESNWRVDDAAVVKPPWLLDRISMIKQTAANPSSRADELSGAEVIYRNTLTELPQLSEGYPIVVEHRLENEQLIVAYDDSERIELASDLTDDGKKLGLDQLRTKILSAVNHEFGEGMYNEKLIPALVTGKFLKPAVRQPLVFYATEGIDPDIKFARELTGEKAPGGFARMMTAKPAVRASLVDKGQHANLEGFEQPTSFLSEQGMIFLPLLKQKWHERSVQAVTVSQSEGFVKEMYYAGPSTENLAVNLAWFRSDASGEIIEIRGWNQWMFESEVELLRALHSQQIPLSKKLKVKAGIQDE